MLFRAVAVTEDAVGGMAVVPERTAFGGGEVGTLAEGNMDEEPEDDADGEGEGEGSVYKRRRA